MVVLSAAVCDRHGKPIVGRQFVNMPRPRAEGLLAAFSKLLTGETGKQHTYIESENVRYVYQPLEDLYVVLITNRNSNIVQDLDTIKLLSKVIPETVGMTSESAVSERMFEIIFAFDEVITQGGHREEVNLEQVRTNLEMESHEERLAQMIKQSKENEAKEQSRRQQMQIRQKKREEQQRNAALPAGVSSMQGAGPSSIGSSSYGGIGSSSMDVGRHPPSSGPSSTSLPSSTEEKKKPQGMKLGSKKEGKQNANLAAMMAEEGLSMGSQNQNQQSAESAVSAATEAAAAASKEAVVTTIKENLAVSMTRDGSASMTVKGVLDILCQQAAATCIRVQLARGKDKNFKFQCHPNTHKPSFQNDDAIVLKDGKKGFPLDSPVSVVRWRSGELDESAVPLSINCWPNDLGNGVVTLTIDYSLQQDMTLDHVVIKIPLPSNDEPHVKECEQGTYVHNAANGVFEWHLDTVSNDNPDGSLEVDVRGDDADAFFPINVHFQSEETICPIGVKDVISSAEGKSVRFSSQKSLTVKTYTIE